MWCPPSPQKRALRGGNLNKFAFLLSGLWTLSFCPSPRSCRLLGGNAGQRRFERAPRAPGGGPRVLGRRASVSSSPRVLGMSRKARGMYCGLGSCFFLLQTKGENKGRGTFTTLAVYILGLRKTLQHSRATFSVRITFQKHWGTPRVLQNPPRVLGVLGSEIGRQMKHIFRG